MKLNKLLKAIEVKEAYNNKNIEINHVVCNSKNVTRDDLFVCIKGYKTDGHKYIKDAVENGATAIVVEDYQPELTIPQFVVKNSRVALAALADMYYNHPSRKLKVIGVTATNGKTTTSYMVNSILEHHNLKTGLIGTVEVKYGNYSQASILTTPESVDLHRIFYEMKEHEVTHVCMEVSSSALQLNRVGNVDFDIVSLNNISPEHIDLHGSFEKYFEDKSSLIRNAAPNQWAVLNLDDKYAKSLVDKTEAKVVTYGIENNTGDLWCKNIDISTGRANFTVEILRPIRVGNKIYKGSFKIQLKTSGYHNIYNSMIAIIIGMLCQVPIKTIQESLRTFGGVERRFEVIFEDDFMILDDHFANAANISSTFKTLDKMKYKDLKLVYAIRGSRGPAVIREAAETMVVWAKKLGITNIIASLSKSHVIWKDEVTQEELRIFSEIMAEAGINVELYDELNDAIAKGLSEVEKGDVMLLAGCQGMDYGAKIALEQLHKIKPNIDERTLYTPLEKRIAGIV